MKKALTIFLVLAVMFCVGQAAAFAAEEGFAVVDNDSVSFTVLAQERAADSDYLWTVHIANKTDAEMMLTMSNVVLDGLRAEPFWGVAVAADTEVDTVLCWYGKDLAAAGLGDLESATVAAFDLLAYNREDREAPGYVDDAFTVQFAEEATFFAYTPTEGDMQALDNDACAMYITSLGVDESGLATARMVLVNKADYAIRFVVTDTYVGTEPFQSFTMDETVPANATAITSSSWSEFSTNWMRDHGFYDEAGNIRSDLPFTMNMIITNNDDVTADTLLAEAVTAAR